MNEHIKIGNEALSQDDLVGARAEFILALGDPDETVQKIASNRLRELQPQQEHTQKSSKLRRDRPQEGWLGFVGYHVGQRGLVEEVRREKLLEAFERTLPKPRFSDGEIYWWGPPRSADRYRKIRERIWGFLMERREKLKNEGWDKTAILEDVAVINWLVDHLWFTETMEKFFLANDLPK